MRPLLLTWAEVFSKNLSPPGHWLPLQAGVSFFFPPQFYPLCPCQGSRSPLPLVGPGCSRWRRVPAASPLLISQALGRTPPWDAHLGPEMHCAYPRPPPKRLACVPACPAWSCPAPTLVALGEAHCS